MATTALQGIYLDIPKADLKLLKELSKKMGWKMSMPEDYVEKYISSRPTDVELTDKDILEEVASVRYGKK